MAKSKATMVRMFDEIVSRAEAAGGGMTREDLETYLADMLIRLNNVLVNKPYTAHFTRAWRPTSFDDIVYVSAEMDMRNGNRYHVFAAPQRRPIEAEFSVDEYECALFANILMIRVPAYNVLTGSEDPVIISAPFGQMGNGTGDTLSGIVGRLLFDAMTTAFDERLRGRHPGDGFSEKDVINAAQVDPYSDCVRCYVRNHYSVQVSRDVHGGWWLGNVLGDNTYGSMCMLNSTPTFVYPTVKYIGVEPFYVEDATSEVMLLHPMNNAVWKAVTDAGYKVEHTNLSEAAWTDPVLALAELGGTKRE